MHNKKSKTSGTSESSLGTTREWYIPILYMFADYGGNRDPTMAIQSQMGSLVTTHLIKQVEKYLGL